MLYYYYYLFVCCFTTNNTPCFCYIAAIIIVIFSAFCLLGLRIIVCTVEWIEIGKCVLAPKVLKWPT